METTITLDLYGNVFQDGANTNQQISDFARNNPSLAPQIDGAWRAKVVEVRAMLAAKDAEIAALRSEKESAVKAASDAEVQVADKDAEIAALKVELDALKAVAPAPIETPAEIQSDSTTE